MSAIHWGLLLVGLFGLLTSTVYLGMVLAGARRFRRDAVLEDARLGRRPEFLPAISLFKPLHGDEAGLEANLRTFFEQDYLQHVARAGGAGTCAAAAACFFFSRSTTSWYCGGFSV